jgi:hypothetical protein
MQAKKRQKDIARQFLEVEASEKSDDEIDEDDDEDEIKGKEG